MKKIAIIGAGPGGLAAGMVLSKKGYEIHIYEKDDQVGGRSKQLTLGEYKFDVGPTFLMYLEILETVFKLAGHHLQEELELIELDHLYSLHFNDVTFELNKDPLVNKAMYESYKKGLGDSYMMWLHAQEKKMKAIAPILKKPFPSVLHFLRPDVLKAAPYVHPFQSVYSHLSTYNKDDNFIHSLSFQAKYLGMASYDAPSLFTILPYLEHALGLYHVKGGLNQINHKMSEIFQKNGGFLHLNSEVQAISVIDQKAVGLKVHDQQLAFDYIIINQDFAHAMNTLVDSDNLVKYTPKKLERKKFSVSTFMLYLGLNKEFDFSHHEILFSHDYEAYLKGLVKGNTTQDISIYMHNPSLLDKTLAPPGHSSLFILVPVPNLRSVNDWDTYSNTLRDLTLDIIEKKKNVDIRSHIKEEKIITPKDWQNDFNVMHGAVFSMSHNLGQMLHKRPHNKFEEIKNIYLVGGGTHPGSGLPTIYQSAVILDRYFKNRKGE